jgi:penicillin G amidase
LPRSRIRLGCLTALAAGAGLFLLCLNGYRTLVASLPDTEGRLRLAGLGGEVRVIRDGYGVPAVFAGNRRDLFFALGFVTAQDRLFQMELSRRTAAGRLSEILGPSALGADSLMRKIGLRAAALEAAAVLPPASDGILKAYAAGVNAAVGGRDSRLPVELKYLGAAFEPWTAADCIAVIRLLAWQADARWLVEPVRRALSADVNPPREIPADLSGRLLGVLSAAVSRPVPEGLPADPFFGAFGLAFSGGRMFSGRPLLVHVPCAAVQIPSPWYQAVLRSPDFEAAGFTVPGYPLVLSGHNASAAWAFAPAGGAESPYRTVQWDEGRDSRLRKDALAVLNAAGVPVEVARTPSGPLICRMPASGPEGRGPVRGLALEWAGLEPFDETGTLLAMNRSGTAAEFVSKSTGLRLPGFAWIAADTAGGVDISGPRPPASGRKTGSLWIVAPDLRCRGNLDAAAPGNSWSLPRFSRFASVLSGTDSLSLSDVRGALTDAVSPRASFLMNFVLPVLTAAPRSDSTEASALRLLAGWTGEMRPGSAAAAVAETFFGRLSVNVFKEGPGGAAADSLAARLPSVLLPALQNRLVRPGAVKETAASVEKSFSEAVSMLRENQGGVTEAWNWGSLHTLEFRHPLGNRWLFEELFKAGPYPMGESPSTIESWVHRTGKPPFRIVSGPSARLIVDLSGFDRSVSVISTGQSGQYMDVHYRDQMQLFVGDDYRPDLWDRDKIERSGGSTLILEPEKSP